MLPKFDTNNPKRVVYPGARATGNIWIVNAHQYYYNYGDKPILYGTPMAIDATPIAKPYQFQNRDHIAVCPVLGGSTSQVIGIALPPELGSMGSEASIIYGSKGMGDLDTLEGYLERWSAPAFDPNSNEPAARVDVLTQGSVYVVVAGLEAAMLTDQTVQTSGIPAVFDTMIHNSLKIKGMMTIKGDTRLQTGDLLFPNSHFAASEGAESSLKLPFTAEGVNVYLLPLNFNLGVEEVKPEE
jgi:hypothetical protein